MYASDRKALGCLIVNLKLTVVVLARCWIYWSFLFDCGIVQFYV